MEKKELIAMLQADMDNELKHQFYYAYASVSVSGPHREELGEMFAKEAHEELTHVMEFASMITYLGGVPGHGDCDDPVWECRPEKLLRGAAQMEQEVADNYARRLVATAGAADAATMTVHLFYEEHISHSQKKAWELRMMGRDV